VRQRDRRGEEAADDRRKRERARVRGTAADCGQRARGTTAAECERRRSRSGSDGDGTSFETTYCSGGLILNQYLLGQSDGGAGAIPPPLRGPRLGRGVGSADRCRDFSPIPSTTHTMYNGSNSIII